MRLQYLSETARPKSFAFPIETKKYHPEEKGCHGAKQNHNQQVVNH